MLQWLSNHQTLLTWLSVISLFTFVVSLLSLPWLSGKIPEDYFMHNRRGPTQLRERHPFIRLCILVGKNLFGFVLLCGGIIMLFLPGQGLLTIAMGLLLMDYPGKYRLERRIASHPSVLKGINWLRAKGNHPPLKLDSA